jgi:hypothetical protein
MINTIDINKSVPRDRWSEFFDLFSNGNRGRHISIEVISSEVGTQKLIQDAPLMALVYDRPGKGDDLAIEVGKDEVTYAHTINSPVEVLTGQDSDGLMMAIQVTDTTGTKTVVKLQVI